MSQQYQYKSQPVLKKKPKLLKYKKVTKKKENKNARKK